MGSTIEINGTHLDTDANVNADDQCELVLNAGWTISQFFGLTQSNTPVRKWWFLKSKKNRLILHIFYIHTSRVGNYKNWTNGIYLTATRSV